MKGTAGTTPACNAAVIDALGNLANKIIDYDAS
jgi:hypothetical protein